MEDQDVCYFPCNNGTYVIAILANLSRADIAARQPKILDTFAKLWGTDDLIVSFDGINISQPINEKAGRTDVKPTDAWPRKTPSPYNQCAAQ